jgi:hypothetical protein
MRRAILTLLLLGGAAIHYTPGNPRTFLGGLAYRF